jgi:hypothetical protein
VLAFAITMTYRVNPTAGATPKLVWGCDKHSTHRETAMFAADSGAQCPRHQQTPTALENTPKRVWGWHPDDTSPNLRIRVLRCWGFPSPTVNCTQGKGFPGVLRNEMGISFQRNVQKGQPHRVAPTAPELNLQILRRGQIHQPRVSEAPRWAALSPSTGTVYHFFGAFPKYRGTCPRSHRQPQ